jgi:hypothetical protein
MSEHWSNEFEHTSITDDNRAEFTTAMKDFKTMDDAIIGGFNAKKLVGKPFRMPESLDKLPDDASRNDFTSQAHKLLGINIATDIEGLADMDMKLDHDKSVEQSEDVVNAFKAFVLENKINKADAQKMVGFHNRMMKNAREVFAQQEEKKKLDAATKTNEALIAHFKSEDEVAKQSELMKRAFQNKAGLSAEEFEQVGSALADSVLTKDPILAKAIITLVAPLAAEGTTEDGGGTGGGSKDGTKKDPNEGSPTYKALGWS